MRKHALFCPIVKASEVLEPRWTLLILNEMGCGSTRFNDIRRGVPGISPTLLSKRLRKLTSQGLIERVDDSTTGKVDYLLSDSARELEPILEQLGKWAYRNTDAEDQLCWLDPKYFMWNLRRAINIDALPRRRVVLQFSYPDWESEPRDFWVIACPGSPVDVCFQEPGFNVDLYVTAQLRALVGVYFGRVRLREELKAARIHLSGSKALASSIESWLGLSSLASDVEPVAD